MANLKDKYPPTQYEYVAEATMHHTPFIIKNVLCRHCLCIPQVHPRWPQDYCFCAPTRYDPLSRDLVVFVLEESINAYFHWLRGSHKNRNLKIRNLFFEFSEFIETTDQAAIAMGCDTKRRHGHRRTLPLNRTTVRARIDLWGLIRTPPANMAVPT